MGLGLGTHVAGHEVPGPAEFFSKLRQIGDSPDLNQLAPLLRDVKIRFSKSKAQEFKLFRLPTSLDDVFDMCKKVCPPNPSARPPLPPVASCRPPTALTPHPSSRGRHRHRRCADRQSILFAKVP